MRGLVVLVALVVAVPPAVGSPATEAEAHNKEGLRLYNTQDYAAAIAEWKQAYRLVPSSDTLFAIGQAQRLGGDCRAALGTYRAVLRRKVSNKQTEEILKVMRVCEKLLADERQAKAEREPDPAPDPDRPDPAKVEARPDPEPVGAVTGRESREPTPPNAARTPWYRDWIGNALLGAGVIGVATGTTFFLLGRSAEADARVQPSYGEFAGSAATARRDRMIAIVGFAAGSALVIGGVVRYVTRSDRRSAEVSAWLVPDGGGVTWARGF